MVRQFLLNPDGSTPAGTDLDVIHAAGIPIVVPTPQWEPPSGFVLEERDPEPDENGVLRQVWVEVPAPEPELLPEPAPAEDPLAALTPEQKQALIALLSQGG